MSSEENYYLNVFIEATANVAELESVKATLDGTINPVKALEASIDKLSEKTDWNVDATVRLVEAQEQMTVKLAEAEKEFIKGAMSTKELAEEYKMAGYSAKQFASNMEELNTAAARSAMSFEKAIGFIQKGVNIVVGMERALMRLDIASMRVETANMRLETSQNRATMALERYNDAVDRVSELQKELSRYTSEESTRIQKSISLLTALRSIRIEGLRTMEGLIGGNERLNRVNEELDSGLGNLVLSERVLASVRDNIGSPALEQLLSLESALMDSRNDLIDSALGIESAELSLEAAQLRVAEAEFDLIQAEIMLSAARYAYGDDTNAITPYLIAYQRAQLELKFANYEVTKSEYDLTKAQFDFAESIMESQEATVGLNSTLEEIETTGGQLISTDDRMIQLLEQIAGATEDVSKQNTYYEDSLRQVDIAQNFVEQASGRMGLAYAGLAVSTVGAISQTLNLFKSLGDAGGITSIFEGIIGTLTGSVVHLGSGVSGVSVLFSTLSSTVIPGLGVTLGAIALPITLIVAAIAALYAAWYFNWGGMRDTLNDIWASMLTVFDPIKKVLNEIWEKYGAQLQAAWDAMCNAIYTVWDFIWAGIGRILTNIWFNGLKPILDVLMNAIALILSVFLGDFDKLKEYFSTWANSVLDMIIKPILGIGTLILQALGLGDLATNLQNWINENTGNLAGAITDVLTNAFTSLGAWWGPIQETITTGITNLFSGAQAWWDGVKPGLQAAGASIMTFITDGFIKPASEGIQAIGKWLGSIYQTVTSYLGIVGSKFTEVGSGLINAVINGILGPMQDALGNVGKWLADILTTARLWLQGAIGRLGQIGTDIVMSILNALPAPFAGIITFVGTALGQVFTGIASWVVNNASRLFSAGVDLVGSFAQGIADFFGGGISWLTNQIWTFFTEGIRGIPLIGNLIADNLINMSEAVSSFFSGGSQDVDEFTNSLVNASDVIGSIGESTIEASQDFEAWGSNIDDVATYSGYLQYELDYMDELIDYGTYLARKQNHELREMIYGSSPGGLIEAAKYTRDLGKAFSELDFPNFDKIESKEYQINIGEPNLDGIKSLEIVDSLMNLNEQVEIVLPKLDIPDRVEMIIPELEIPESIRLDTSDLFIPEAMDVVFRNMVPKNETSLLSNGEGSSLHIGELNVNIRTDSVDSNNAGNIAKELVKEIRRYY